VIEKSGGLSVTLSVEQRSVLAEYAWAFRMGEPRHVQFDSYADCVAMGKAIDACLHATMGGGAEGSFDRETLSRGVVRLRAEERDRYSLALRALYEVVQGMAEAPVPDRTSEASVALSRRDCRRDTFEVIGCALAVLQRLDHVWRDDDIRATLTQVRSALAAAQSKIKERIDG
jgi:hypothetical protein